MLKYACSVAVFVGVLGVYPAHSQTGSGSFVGRVPAHDGCPDLTLHIIRSSTSLSGGSRLQGVVFRTDGTGTSNVAGEVSGNVVKFSLTPTAGQGPQGDVEGTI